MTQVHLMFCCFHWMRSRVVCVAEDVARSIWVDLSSTEKEAYLDSVHYYREPKKRARSDALSIDERICIALARMGTQGENQTVGDIFGRDGAVVAQCLDQFANAICVEFKDEFVALPDLARCREYMAYYMLTRGIPAVIGQPFTPSLGEVQQSRRVLRVHTLIVWAAISHEYTYARVPCVHCIISLCL